MNSALNTERITIDIDPDTLEYKLEMNYCKLDHVYAVLKTLVERIETNDLGPDVETINGTECSTSSPKSN